MGDLMTLIKSIFMAFFALLSLALAPAMAQDADTAANDPDGAFAFISELSSNAIKVLDDPQLTQDERNDEFRRLLREGFDLDYIGRLVLGRHARNANKNQLESYKSVFPEYVLQIYSNRLKERGDETFEVDSTTPAGKRDLYVRSRIVRPDGPDVAADWRVRKIEGAFRIVDLKIEGISMAITQRDEFSAKVNADGIDALITFMREQTGTDTPSASAPISTAN